MPRRIELRSDNAAGVAPEIMAAVVAAGEGSALAYGGDEWSARLRERVADVFEYPDVTVFPVASGTAANALGLAALTPPWGAVLCHETAHILNSEGGATSTFGGGAVMRGLAGPSSKLVPSSVRELYDQTWWGDPHHSQPAVVSLTCPTDHGAVYTSAEVAALAEVAAEHSLHVHMDGARIANAIDVLGCRPSELTWRAGVDVLSLGATKNGALSTDAIVCFDQRAGEELVYRTKRAGHVASKMRFQSAQLDAYLTDDLWLRLAATANRAMAIIAAGIEGLDIQVVGEPEVNMMFARVPVGASARLAECGLLFYEMGGDAAGELVRFVTSFQTTSADADEVVRRIAAAVA
ncbi:MAG: beta-eliminating lyase-related protein [Ilumatobacteraceae bacterium]